MNSLEDGDAFLSSSRRERLLLIVMRHIVGWLYLVHVEHSTALQVACDSLDLLRLPEHFDVCDSIILALICQDQLCPIPLVLEDE